MGTEVMKSFGTLQSELERAKTNLRGVDEHIKRLIGRDPSESVSRGAGKRPAEERPPRKGFAAGQRQRPQPQVEADEPPAKRRPAESSVFKRLSERPKYADDEDVESPGKQVISKVIATPKEVPSRQEVLAAQGADEKSKARNRRMFGALLGTLQKFQQEETKLKPMEEKRTQIERKLEEQELKEREELKKEKQELFLDRKRKQAEIRMIELKMLRMKEYASWEEKQKPKMNFILTKSQPPIYYLPRVMSEKSRNLLGGSKHDIERSIEDKRTDVYAELEQIEARSKRIAAVKANSQANNQPQEPMEEADEEEQDEEEEGTVHAEAEEAKHNLPRANSTPKDDELEELPPLRQPKTELDKSKPSQ